MSITDIYKITFNSQNDFEIWLAKNHATCDVGIWLQIHKKASKLPTVTYAEALDVALCYGWIDGQKKPLDEKSWLQKFTPRRAKSVWSKINTGHVERLIKAGKMKPAGQKVIDAAKQDGRWARAYDSAGTSSIPQDFLDTLSPKAQAFFETLNKQNKYAISYRLQNAKKPETREKRMKEFLAMLERGEKLYP